MIEPELTTLRPRTPDVLINSDIPGGKEAQKEIGTELEYFSLPVELDANGAKTIKPMGPMCV